MNKRLLLTPAISFFICMGILAQEWWIQPKRAHVLVGERVPMEVYLGDNFTGARWRGNGSRISSYRHYHGNDVKDLLLSLAPGESLVSVPDFIATEEGTHILVLSTNNAFIETEAGKFEDYLKDDGLMHAYEYRYDNNEKFEKGLERFRRCAKTILQVGEETTNTYKEKTNLILDIIPLKNPYDHEKDQGLTFKILYEEEPLPDAMVKWWYKNGDVVETDFLFTSPKGEVTFSAAKPGMYMISVVHMVRLENHRSADWQSTKSSLVFGIEE